MKDRGLISVIVPVYNIAGYVSKCLESIGRQSYADLEIIVVDDGSTDDSGKVCDGFAKKDKRIKVFHKKNGGLSDARNFGIKKAQGKMIALVDGDDYVEVNFIKVMYEAMIKNGSDIVVCGFNGGVPNVRTISGEEATKELLVGQENMEIVAWNKLYRRELFDNIEYPMGEKYEDSLTTYKLLSLAKKVSYVPKSLYNYVIRNDSIMGQSEILERLKAREKAAREAVDYFSDNSGLKKAAEVAVLTSKYAFMDAAIHGKINSNYYKENAEWIKNNRNKYKNNKLLTKKLKVYNFLNQIGLYKAFRTII